MNPLLQQFLSEARDLVQDASDRLLLLERRTDDRELVNDIFRVFHTLKGSSGLFDLIPFTQALHAAEDVLASVRAGQIPASARIVDLSLECLDLIGAWLDVVEATEALPASAPEASRDFSTRMRACLPGADAPAAAKEQAAGTALDWLQEVPEPARMEAFLRAEAAGSLLSVEYDPDPRCFFNGDDPLGLVGQVPDAVAVVVRQSFPPASDPAFDPFSCGLGFRVLTLAPRDELEALFRYVKDQVRIAEVQPERLMILRGSETDAGRGRAYASRAARDLAARDGQAVRDGAVAALAETDEDSLVASVLRWVVALVDGLVAPWRWLDGLVQTLVGPQQIITPSERAALIRVLDEQRAMLRAGEGREDFAGRAGSAARTSANALRHAGAPGAVEMETALARTQEEGGAGSLIAALDRAIDGLPAEAAPVAAAIPALAEAAAPAALAETARPANGESAGKPMLRVEQEKVDRLMSLIGELVVAKNGLSYLARRAEQNFGVRELAREIKDQYAVVDRLAQEMHGAVMQVRMLPVGQVFQRFPRLVRDIARKLGKQVELVIEGEETEADKNVIEGLFEPLLHMVRNSLDHGLESPEQRLAAGKPEQSRIALRAYQENDHVVIEIEDDGRGIDPAIIRGKAYERGLITEEQMSAMSDREAQELIFAAGFSTAEQVSDISGRGVGMDAVRQAVERANGRIGIDSVVGRGTTVRLSMPLSMAVTRIMTVSVGCHLFGVPMDLIVETVRLPREQVLTIKQRQAFVLRDRVVPLMRLGNLLDLPDPGKGDAEDARVLVVGAGADIYGLEVDAFGEGMEVILKPLEGLLAGVPEYAGTTLLGDGRVLLVLNLREIVR